MAVVPQPLILRPAVLRFDYMPGVKKLSNRLFNKEAFRRLAFRRVCFRLRF